MIISQCTRILCELSEIEKKISYWESILEKMDIEVDKEDLLRKLILLKININPH